MNDAPSPTQEHEAPANFHSAVRGDLLERYHGWRLDEIVRPIRDALRALERQNEDRVWRAAAAAGRAIDALTRDRNEWRRVAQGATPGGSEYSEPSDVAAHISGLRIELHEAKCEIARLRKAARKDGSPPQTGGVS